MIRFAYTLLSVALLTAAQHSVEPADSQSRAEQLFARGDYAGAAAAAREDLRLNPRATGALVLLSLTEIQTSQLQSAEGHLLQAAAQRPDDPRILSYLGSLYLQQRRYPAARAAFRRVLKLEPRNPVALYNSGLIALAEGEPSLALKHFERVLALSPSDTAAMMGMLEANLLRKDPEATRKTARLIAATASPEARLQMAAMLASYNDFETAIPVLENLHSERPKDYQVSYTLALAWYKLRHYPEAERAALSSAENSARAETFDLLGLIQADQGRHTEATASFARAVALDPGTEDYRLDLAGSVLEYGSVQAGADLWEAACRDFSSSWRARVGRGAALYLLGQYGPAADSLLEASRLSPDVPIIYQLLGRLYGSEPAKDDAIRRAIAEYLRRKDADAQVRFLYGRILYSLALAGQGSFGLAKTEIEKALLEEPHLAEAALQLAIIAQQEGSFDDGVKFLKRAIHEDPKLPDAHYRLGIIYGQQGHADLAKAEFDIFRELKPKPDSFTAAETLRLLTSRSHH